jgi:hypothetical protein
VGSALLFYLFTPTYYVTAHPAAKYLARKHGLLDSKCIVIFLKEKEHEEHGIKRKNGVIPMRTNTAKKAVPIEFADRHPVVRTCGNVSLAATHLAIAMLPKRIVFIGVEMKNGLHFFSLDDELRRKITADVLEDHDATVGKGLAKDICLLREALASADKCRARPFYPPGFWMSLDKFKDQFRKYWAAAENAGIEIVNVSKNSVLSDMGVDFIPPEEVLGG